MPWVIGLAAAAGLTGCAQTSGAGAAGAPSHPASITATPAASSSPSAPASTVSPSTAGTPVCADGQLKIRMIYGGPAAGTVGGVLGFTNTGSAPCELAGWPILVAVSTAGRTTAERSLGVFSGPTLTAPPTVTIKPGAQAVAVLAGHDEPAPGSTKCPPAYRRLRVIPPGSAHITVVSAWIPYFDAYLPACTPIQISPVIPASTLAYLRLHHL
ncbi:MAG TPA: DUF4232 domain-containing protein [Streptosporangiaceae bacterium]